VLLVGAGLFVRSLSRAKNVDLGVEPDRVVQIGIRWLASDAAPEDQRAHQATVFRQALERLRAQPDIEYSAIVVGTPFRSSFTVGLRVSGRDSIPDYPGGGPHISAITDQYFETAGLSLLEGRSFSAADRRGSEPVAIVDRAMARDLFPRGRSIGRCLYIDDQTPNPPCSRIIGIVQEAHRFGLREDAALQYYIPVGQEHGFGGSALMYRPGRSARMAVGARARDVLAMVVRQGTLVALAGLAIGTIIALAAGRFLNGVLFDTSARDPLVLGVAILTMFAAALLASLIPAWRAAHIDPVAALKVD